MLIQPVPFVGRLSLSTCMGLKQFRKDALWILNNDVPILSQTPRRAPFFGNGVFEQPNVALILENAHF